MEDFYIDLYNSSEHPQIETNAISSDVPNITTEEIIRALEGMKRGKTVHKSYHISHLGQSGF